MVLKTLSETAHLYRLYKGLHRLVCLKSMNLTILNQLTIICTTRAECMLISSRFLKEMCGTKELCFYTLKYTSCP